MGELFILNTTQFNLTKMKDTQISSNEIIDSSVSFARTHCGEFDVNIRKNKGQFFTPKKVANFMANSVIFDNDNIHILDPGAGTGILIAAVCDRIVEQKKNTDRCFN